MRPLLMTTAIVETTTGIVLLVVPTWLASVLLGGALDTSESLTVARLAGAAVLSLGVACWCAGGDWQSRAAGGVVAAMLLYNLAVVVLLLSWRYTARMAGPGLLPAAALHAALAVWCFTSLGAPRRRHSAPTPIEEPLRRDQ